MTKPERKFETFETELDGVMTEFKVYEPNLVQQREGMKVRNRTFADSVNSGAFLKVQLTDIMRERGLWNDAKQNEYFVLEQKILAGKTKIDEGGFKLSEAKELALNMREWRDTLIEMRTAESQLTNETAEGQADNASFNYLVSVCVVYNTTDDLDKYEQPVFSGLDDYLNRSTTELAISAARCLAAMTYGVPTDIKKQLPENEFLLEYGFVDDELRLVNQDGELINEEDEVVDEDGLTNEDKKVVEHKPFLDDDGSEIVKKEEEEIVGDAVGEGQSEDGSVDGE